MISYRYEMSGTGAEGHTWATAGIVPDAWGPEMFGAIMHQSFAMLTEGRAVYGEPGKGCKGPYVIDRLLIERRKHE